MFFSKQKKELILYRGRLQKKIGFWQAVALVVSSTVGAGIIGVPYAIKSVGFPLGVIYIIGVGLLMMYMNLLIGEVVARSNKNFQLSGLVKKYMGTGAQIFMTAIIYFIIVGALIIYIIGVGNGLSALLHGSSLMWSTIFFLVSIPLVFTGIQAIKRAELILTIAIIAMIGVIAIISLSGIDTQNFTFINPTHLLAPYGVILFAFHSSVSVPEAHALIRNNRKFRSVIITASLISTAIFLVFTTVVIGVTGSETSPIATIAFGEALGHNVFLFTNIFALLAMGTSFFILGLSLRDSIHWDLKVKPWLAGLLTLGVPFGIFILGFREFIKAIEVVGGIFISLELLMMIAIYWRIQHHNKHLKTPTQRVVRHTHLFLAILLTALVIGMTYSILNIF